MMEWWHDIEWVHPWRLIALLLPLLVLFTRKKIRGKYGLFFGLSDIGNLRALLSWRTWALRISPYLLALAAAMLIIAWARPRFSLTEEEITAEGIDIFLVMDLSSSMLARDFEPDRLSVSKEVAAQFVDKRVHDRIGLTVFAGEAFTQCPLTTDHGILKNFLSDLACGQLDDGTAIGMGLASALNRIKDSEANSKVVILLTDGVNNAGYIQPKTAAEIAATLGVRIYAIGVGSMGEALTPVRRAMDGSYLYGMARVEIDEPLLREVTKMTGGQYYRATSEEALLSIYNEIDQLEKTKMQVTVLKRYKEAFRPLVWSAVLLLTIEFLFSFIFIRQAGL